MSKSEEALHGELVVGSIAAFLFFPVGWAVGAHLLSRNHRTDGIMVISVSSAIGVVSVLGGIALFEDGAFVLLAAAGIAIVLVIALLAQRPRAGAIAVVVGALIVALVVGISAASREQEEQTRKEAEKLADCLAQQAPAKACWRRFREESE